jgi:hypothetical protein
MEIRKERGFPQQLEKSLAKDARLFHSSHRPNNKDLSRLYCRQRSTLRRLNCGPKDGEHLRTDQNRQDELEILPRPGLRFALNASPFGRRRAPLRPGCGR